MRILLVDDHPVFRAGLEALLKEMEPSVEVLHAGSCGEGIRIARQRPLNLAFLDLNLPDGNGLDCLVAMKTARPSLPVVVVSGEEVDRGLVERALELKAMGFVPKSENADMIIAALRAALAGGVFLPTAMIGTGTASSTARLSFPTVGTLQYGHPYRRPAPTRAVELGVTPRQGDVLRYLVQGLPNKTIAANLGISVPVVKKHVSDLLAHFKTVSRTQLVAQIAQRGIFFGPPDLSDPKNEISQDGE